MGLAVDVLLKVLGVCTCTGSFLYDNFSPDRICKITDILAVPEHSGIRINRFRLTTKKGKLSKGRKGSMFLTKQTTLFHCFRISSKAMCNRSF